MWQEGIIAKTPGSGRRSFSTESAATDTLVRLGLGKPLSGKLRKKSRRGQWQERFFELHNFRLEAVAQGPKLTLLLADDSQKKMTGQVGEDQRG